MKSYTRLYSAYIVNSFGSWLTFLAIALITQEKYGTQYVALVFLVQTLPSILFSRSLARLIPIGRQEQVFVVSQILLSLNCVVLIFNQSLPVIFAHLFAGALLRSVSAPLLNTLVGKWVPKESLTHVFTRVGALQSGTLAFAPMAGAWLKIAAGASVLFAIDALSFLISLVLLKELFSSPSGETRFQFQWKSLFTELAPYPRDLTPETRRVLIVWFMFLTVGALLNAIEFPGFEIHQLDEQKIGYALGAWGAGSLFAFLLPLRLKNYQSSALFLGALTMFASTGLGWVGVVMAFLLGGLFSAYLSGNVRADLQKSVPHGSNSALVWAYANQITQLISLIAYASAGALLGIVGFHTFSYLMLASGLILVALCWRLKV